MRVIVVQLFLLLLRIFLAEYVQADGATFDRVAVQATLTKRRNE